MIVRDLKTKLQGAKDDLVVRLCDEDGNVSEIAEINVEDDEVIINYELDSGLDDDEEE